MARRTIRERRREKKEATIVANEFIASYVEKHPRASAEDIKEATNAELSNAGFDISTIGAILEVIMKLIEMFRKK
jgi:phage-related minor tail protein